MARVPSVTNISDNVPEPEPRRPDVDAGVLDVDADVPDDFDWEAVDDENEQVTCSDDDKTHRDSDRIPDPPPQQSNGENSRVNGHPPSQRASDPQSVVSPPRPSQQSPPTHPPQPRPDGVVADPMGVNGLEDGEIEQKHYKRNKKRKPPSQRLHCEICDIYVTGQITMDSHLKGKNHKMREKQAMLKDRNVKISTHGKTIAAQSAPSHDNRQRPDQRGSSRVPSQPATSTNAPGERENPSGRTENRAQRRDPYAVAERERRTEGPHGENRPERSDMQTNSRDPRLKSRGFQNQRNDGDAVMEDVVARPEQRKGLDPYYAAGRRQDSFERGSSSQATRNQNGLPPRDESVPEQKKRKYFEDTAQSAQNRSNHPSNRDREGRRRHDVMEAGPMRRSTPNRSFDPRARDPYASRDAFRQPDTSTRKLPPHSAPPALVSMPAPNDRHDDRRTSDQARRFTYGSVRREASEGESTLLHESTLIPQEWLSQPFTLEEWRHFHDQVFESGDEVDQLAFKIMQEVLIAPVAGISTSALAPYSRAMLEAVQHQYVSSENQVYANFEDFPEELSVRDHNFSRADPEWQKTQTPEQLAVRLVGDNVVFCLNAYEDAEAAMSTDPEQFPRRGSFGQHNVVKSAKDRKEKEEKDESVEGDTLLNHLYESRLKRCRARV